ncbi:hypothetical protein ACFQY7_18635 [Actinomadura luteofluorescens]|uniref:Uncharacterized protein n=1 Tax=Actinomadura luteofluorescens TaxID=46163 RepID=A0A7Y9EPN0_9ACTN|nr:hypothetical protein [Actinomadura luteofluorescens]NYD51613.1 hypothetical protein [Actinomadura luteofluorescens]
MERNIIEVLMQPLGPFGPFGPLVTYVEHTRGSNVVTIFRRTMHMGGASDVRAEGRIHGATASLIYIDEATLNPRASCGDDVRMILDLSPMCGIAYDPRLQAWAVEASATNWLVYKTNDQEAGSPWWRCGL